MVGCDGPLLRQSWVALQVPAREAMEAIGRFLADENCCGARDSLQLGHLLGLGVQLCPLRRLEVHRLHAGLL